MENKQKDYSILFVDDEQNALKYFIKLFSKEFSVITSDNVNGAKEILDDKSDEIAILLTDQRMPDQCGTDLLSYARENHPHIIRLLTTAYTDLEDAIHAVNDGEILRYLTKPWDFNALNAELKYAMRFFMLRHERDQLLKEKLNVKQRMVELNRARDLIVMASGITHLRNPVQAVAAFLTQLPKLKRTQTADLKSLDVWGLLEDEIKKQLEISNGVLTETREHAGFQENAINTLIEKASADFDGKVELKNISESVIKCDKGLIEKMLRGVIDALLLICPENEKPCLSMQAASGGVKIVVHANAFDQDALSLLTTPVALLMSFYICYHHGGELNINTHDGISYEITLPSEPDSKQSAKLNEDWIEEILQRFEEWPE